MSADDLIGETLGDYRLEQLLGAGGMGAVYLAHDVALDRPVAVKVILEEGRHDSERNARFLSEARAAARLVHSGIAQIYRVGEQDGVVYMALELVHGRPLRDFIRRGPLPIEAVVDVGAQIADALGAAHQHQIVHRDLKPDNVMVTPGGVAKVLDFGLAKAFGDEGAAAGVGLTQEGAVVGTPAYMSPEQATGGPLDGRSDVFSFGVLLFEALTGRLPFRGDTASRIVMAIVRDPPADLGALRTDVPPALAALVSRCLDKEPAGRFASGAELKAALDAVGVTPAPGHGTLTGTMDALPPVERGPAMVATEAATKVTPSATAALQPQEVPAPAPAPVASRSFPKWILAVAVAAAWGVGWAAFGDALEDRGDPPSTPASTLDDDSIAVRSAAGRALLEKGDSKTALAQLKPLVDQSTASPAALQDLAFAALLHDDERTRVAAVARLATMRSEAADAALMAHTRRLAGTGRVAEAKALLTAHRPRWEKEHPFIGALAALVEARWNLSLRRQDKAQAALERADALHHVIDDLAKRAAVMTATRLLRAQAHVVAGAESRAAQALKQLRAFDGARYDLLGGDRDVALWSVHLAARVPIDDVEEMKGLTSTELWALLPTKGMSPFEASWALSGYGRSAERAAEGPGALQQAYALRKFCLDTLDLDAWRCRAPLALAAAKIAHYEASDDVATATGALAVFDRMWPRPDQDLLPTRLANEARATLEGTKAARDSR